ncbi:MAG: hypothetical protein LBU82_05505 [Treponema sp.]|nr:hypothetical protein [Treponema sp.]
MKKNVFGLVMPVIALALSVAVIGCASSPAPEPIVPDIDYSSIGPEDSVILAYLDPQVVLKVDNKVALDVLYGTRAIAFSVTADKYISPPMSHVKFLNKGKPGYSPTSQSCQMQIPNGTYTLTVVSANIADDTQGAILPFKAAFDNVAITYKIRPATNAEKEAAGIGVGDMAYTMDEVAQKKLR